MTVEADRRLAALAEGAHGVFTIEHARECGLSEAQIKHRVATRGWIRVFEVCYRFAGTPLLWRGSLLAACWAGNAHAVASHRSAAALWQLPGGREDILEITCPRWLRGRHPGVVVHETKALDRCDRTVVHGIPVTSVERTLLDLAAVCGDATVEMALDRAELRDLTTPARLRAAVIRLSKPGRRGIVRLRRVLDLRAPESGPAKPRRRRSRPAESPAETLLLRVLRRHGFPRPVLQYVVRDHDRFVARVDAGYPDERIAIEYESYEWHLGRVAIERDNSRRNALQAIDWAVVGVTARDLRTGGDQLAHDLRRIRALRRQ